MNIAKILQFITVFTLIHLILISESKFCPGPNALYSETAENNDSSTAEPEYRPTVITCPTSTDPLTHTECCPLMGPHRFCCPPHRHFYEIDNTLATIILASVITACVILAALFIVCCFYSKCPLYNTCRAQYVHSDVVALEKESETMELNNMPAETNNKNKHIYAPNNLNTGSAV